MRLLLISNSTNAGEDYLYHPRQQIRDFLGKKPTLALFIPYAGVTVAYSDYETRVKVKFNELEHDIRSVHHYPDPVKAVESAEVIVIGGGNTFRLLELMQEKKLTETIYEKVLSGTPYIGWSAGANVACPTICTTNDMPIVQPVTFNAFHLIPFQINPHYLDTNTQDYAGETREMRIQEYIEVNKDVYVAGLREGTMFIIENDKIKLVGTKNVRIFKYGHFPMELSPGDDMQFLMQ